MKKIIKGKAYDTETAVKVGRWSDGRGFDYLAESLYRKRTGEFFIHGEGGARSSYSTACYGGLRGSGEKIMPVTVAEAQSWAEDHLTGEEYEEIFGAVAEDDTRVSVSYCLNAPTVDIIRRLAQERSTSQVAIVQELLDKALAGIG